MPDPLTLARATPLGPYVPATEAMLDGWVSPVLVDIDGALIPGSLIAPDTRPEAERAGPWTVYPRDDDWPDLHDAYKLARSCRTEDIRLDTRREEVRDRLCRLGLLHDALRDHPGAAVAAGMGVAVRGAMPALRNGSPEHYLSLLVQSLVLDVSDGYLIPLPDGGVGFVSKESP